MPPCISDNDPPSRIVHRPNTRATPRIRSVRGARPRAISTSTKASSAAGSSQEISRPISPLNSRSGPGQAAGSVPQLLGDLETGRQFERVVALVVVAQEPGEPVITQHQIHERV